MARMTAQDMVTEARSSLYGETTETLTDNQILRWLNRAYMQIASVFKPYELSDSTTLTTSSGTATATSSASNILDIDSLVDTTNNFTLRPWSEWQYHRATQGDTSNITGTPVYWFVSGATITNNESFRVFTFYPTPAGTYSINVNYTKKPDELVLTPAPTTSLLLEPWDEAILYTAISKGWAFLGDERKSSSWESKANSAANVALSSNMVSSDVPFRPGSVIGNAMS